MAKTIEERLCCGIKAIGVFPEAEAVMLIVPKGHCTDYTGAISVAKDMLPEVSHVFVTDRNPENPRITVYRIEGNHWVARTPRTAEHMQLALRMQEELLQLATFPH